MGGADFSITLAADRHDNLRSNWKRALSARAQKETMKTQIAVTLGMALFCMGLLKTGAAEEANKAIQRIGIYDSRAVAVAYVGSTQHNVTLKRMIAERDKAKAEGDQRRVAELESQGHQQQDLRHRQAFSTAPVDDILQQIANEVEIIKNNQRLTAMVSKWDKEALKQYQQAMKVDVTQPLIDACHPNARQRKAAMEIQKVKPIPPKQLEKHMEAEKKRARSSDDSPKPRL